MRVAFMGTPDFAVPSLRALLESSHAVTEVVTQPDEAKGRGLGTAPPPVKAAALEAGLTVLQPEGALAPEMFSQKPDAVVVVAYGRMLPAAVLDHPPFGCLNVHASLLPRWRGAAPIAAAIRAGDSVTGVTTMRLCERMDAGGILLQHACEIGPRDTAGDLHDRLARLGAGLLMETLRQLEEGGLEARPQDEAQATCAPKLRKSDGLVPWDAEAPEVDRLVRAMTPWPGAFSYLHGAYVKVRRGTPSDFRAGAERPGTIAALDGDDLIIACGGGTAYRVSDIQPGGRRSMTGRAFLGGRHGALGAVFSNSSNHEDEVP
jgi:methionyl-tRNA formyltransferase